ncbi:enamine deaminase RidA (YjgF/YER057c/UK114 family) [Pedobacter cryoconitis]|uniref:RidA family protein n=1 Tax=Pedobacter cryoconitis TaxID=188932 RepID=UPI0017D138A2|nr:RidA family protein [Pedobacter cryoconitis]MBB6271392.1 enamine deaminase RidA (YjgF/YER057c/UK114 family) [Pedobacter cryoconitis]
MKKAIIKKSAKLLTLILLIIAPVLAQAQKTAQMEKRSINPWQWQDERSYVQAVEVKNVQSTLYISGQTAISAEGISSNENMGSQLTKALQNLEMVISKAGYEPKGIVRLNIYTTSTAELWPHFGILQAWIAKHGIKQATTLLEVKSLFETLKVELEATVVK